MRVFTPKKGIYARMCLVRKCLLSSSARVKTCVGKQIFEPTSNSVVTTKYPGFSCTWFLMWIDGEELGKRDFCPRKNNSTWLVHRVWAFSGEKVLFLRIFSRPEKAWKSQTWRREDQLWFLSLFPLVCLPKVNLSGQLQSSLLWRCVLGLDCITWPSFCHFHCSPILAKKWPTYNGCCLSLYSCIKNGRGRLCLAEMFLIQSHPSKTQSSPLQLCQHSCIHVYILSKFLMLKRSLFLKKKLSTRRSTLSLDESLEKAIHFNPHSASNIITAAGSFIPLTETGSAWHLMKPESHTGIQNNLTAIWKAMQTSIPQHQPSCLCFKA